MTTFERVQQVLAEQLDLPQQTITPEFSLTKQAEIDSLGLVDLVLCLEAEFGVHLSDADAQPLDTVAQTVALLNRHLCEK